MALELDFLRATVQHKGDVDAILQDVDPAEWSRAWPDLDLFREKAQQAGIPENLVRRLVERVSFHRLFTKFLAEKKQWPKPGERYRGKPLGEWTTREVLHYRDDLPDWMPHGSNTPAWWDNYDAALAYYEEHDRLPPSTVGSETGSLGGWVNTTRMEFRAGRLSPVQSHAIALHEVLARSPYDLAWDRQFAATETFVEKHDGRFPRTAEEFGGEAVGSWIMLQRKELSAGRLSEERQARLDTLGDWRTPQLQKDQEQAWNYRFGRLKVFLLTHDGQYPSEHDTKIGQWLSSQKGRIAEGRMPEERRALLEALPGWTARKIQRDGTDIWAQRYNQLVRYVARHGSLPGSAAEFEGFALGMWLASQKHRYRRDGLENDQVQRLEALPGWDREEILGAGHGMYQTWTQQAEILLEFVRRKGRLPERGPKAALRHWYEQNLELYERGTRLNAVQERYLEAITQGLSQGLDSPSAKRGNSAHRMARTLESGIPVSLDPGQSIEALEPWLTDLIRHRLAEAGYATVGDLWQASDEALLAVDGLGPSKISLIRKATGGVERFPDDDPTPDTGAR